MQIKYDKKADAKYISIKEEKVVETKPEKDWLLFDYDKDGEIVGIEILDASKRLVSVVTRRGVFVEYREGRQSALQGKERDESLNSYEFASSEGVTLV